MEGSYVRMIFSPEFTFFCKTIPAKGHGYELKRFCDEVGLGDEERSEGRRTADAVMEVTPLQWTVATKNRRLG